MILFFFKQKTAYEMRISDWSSDVCSSDLGGKLRRQIILGQRRAHPRIMVERRGKVRRRGEMAQRVDRKSVVSGKSVSVRVDLGGRSIIKKKTLENTTASYT